MITAKAAANKIFAIIAEPAQHHFCVGSLRNSNAVECFAHHKENKKNNIPHTKAGICVYLLRFVASPAVSGVNNDIDKIVKELSTDSTKHIKAISK